MPEIPEFLGQRSGRTKVPRIFRIFLPNFALRIFPEFFEEFSCFVSQETKTRKNLPKIPALSMQNSQATTKKLFANFFWRAGEVKN